MNPVVDLRDTANEASDRINGNNLLRVNKISYPKQVYI